MHFPTQSAINYYPPGNLYFLHLLFICLKEFLDYFHTCNNVF
jgi:hypothetical protein